MFQTNQIHYAGDPASQNLILQPVDEHDLSLLKEEEAALTRLLGGQDWCIAALPVADWNQELPPWSADPVFGKQGFGDGAAKSLKEILEQVLPYLETHLEANGHRVYLAGYSLAGLFALWSAYQTDLFSGVICASPSVWYPDWISYARSHPIRVKRVYLSLGDKEEKTRNPRMAQVGSCIRTQYQLLTQEGIATTLEWNPGNHFVDSEMRLSRGIAWCLGT